MFEVLNILNTVLMISARRAQLARNRKGFYINVINHVSCSILRTLQDQILKNRLSKII